MDKTYDKILFANIIELFVLFSAIITFIIFPPGEIKFGSLFWLAYFRVIPYAFVILNIFFAIKYISDSKEDSKINTFLIFTYIQPIIVLFSTIIT